MIFIALSASTVFKTIQFETMLEYLHGLFQMTNTEGNLPGSRNLVIPYANTTTYGLHSFIQTEDLRSLTSSNEFRYLSAQFSSRVGTVPVPKFWRGRKGVFTLVPIKNRSRAPCSGTKSERSLTYNFICFFYYYIMIMMMMMMIIFLSRRN